MNSPAKHKFQMKRKVMTVGHLIAALMMNDYSAVRQSSGELLYMDCKIGLGEYSSRDHKDLTDFVSYLVVTETEYKHGT